MTTTNSKIRTAREVIEALQFLGIDTAMFQQLRQKHTLNGLHSKLAEILSGNQTTETL